MVYSRGVRKARVDNVHDRYRKYYFQSGEILLLVGETGRNFDTVCVVRVGGLLSSATASPVGRVKER